MKPPPRPKPAARFIYVIGPETGLQKIGIASDPRRRLATLQTANPFDLILHASVAVPFEEALAVERRAHRSLARSRVRNEWFETSPADAVAAIHAAVAPLRARASAEPLQPWRSHVEWRISRTNRQTIMPTVADPLMQFRTAVEAPTTGSSLPLFDFSHANCREPGFTAATPIEALGACRLEVKCCAGLTSYPLRLLATTLPQGGRTPLSAAVELFRCERCAGPARETVLVDETEVGRPEAWRIEGSSPETKRRQ